MEFLSIHELQKRQKKLAKLLAMPSPLLPDPDPEIAAIEKELFASTQRTIEKKIADIDVEIKERTAGTRR